MPPRESEALVLRSHPLGEADRIVTFLTREVGKVRGVAKGARRSRRRFGSNLELLSRVRLSWFEREGGELVRIEAAELLESFYDLQADPERGAMLACFAEVADCFAREGQEDAAFYRLLHAVLRAVRGGMDLRWARGYFEIWTLRLHGVLPPLDACATCGASLRGRGGRYGRRQGGMACASCAGVRGAGDVAVGAAAVEAAAEILRQPPDAFVGRPADPALAPLASLAAAIFFDLTEKRFRSYDVLQAIRGRS